MRRSFFVMLGIIILLISGFFYVYSPRDIQPICCRSCVAAFRYSPIGVGPEGANCGAFTSNNELSYTCKKYFAQHPHTVASCQLQK